MTPARKPEFGVGEILALRGEVAKLKAEQRLLERANLQDHRLFLSLVIAALLIASVAAVVAVLV